MSPDLGLGQGVEAEGSLEVRTEGSRQGQDLVEALLAAAPRRVPDLAGPVGRLPVGREPGRELLREQAAHARSLVARAVRGGGGAQAVGGEARRPGLGHQPR